MKKKSVAQATSKPTVAKKYWLFKSEPGAYSILDLERDGSTFWDGIRNYQARNFLRDQVQVGDEVLFYHSNAEPMAIMGRMKVTRAGYSDHTAFDKRSCHFDPDSSPDDPTWYMVDVAFVARFPNPVDRDRLRAEPLLRDMMVMQKGSRLSIQPVTSKEWQTVLQLGSVKPSKSE